jgi:predicted nucleic acid-binding protein
MKTEVFIDTSAFYALLVRNDECHDAIVNYMAQAARARQAFLTTDYILDETATLLKARGHGRLAEECLSDILASQSCRIAWMDADLFQDAFALFSRHADQAWSFTDCVSFTVMRQRKLSSALTKDRHFQAAGFQTPLLT